jgi:hypothetical protein
MILIVVGTCLLVLGFIVAVTLLQDLMMMLALDAMGKNMKDPVLVCY